VADVVKILRAFSAGDVVFIESTKRLPDQHLDEMLDSLNAALKDTGVRVVLLAEGMRVAAAEETLDLSYMESPQ
jgi:predicted ATP-grasp superfamily ATP-dependent carboligase